MEETLHVMVELVRIGNEEKKCELVRVKADMKPEIHEASFATLLGYFLM